MRTGFPTHERKWFVLALALLSSLLLLAGCSKPKEPEGSVSGGCVADEECDSGQVCVGQTCQALQCGAEEIACGRDCVNPRIELEFCGGCDGCPGTDNAEGIQCLEGQCIYRCLDGFVDVNDDINDPNGDGCECVPDGPEVCDGVDNDCDGLVDAMDDDLEPCDAENGAEAACVAGICELACTPGFVDVNEDLGMGGNGCECESTGDEVCDGIDNDCDGDIDEDDNDFILPSCQLTEGVCAGLFTACESGQAVECSEDQFERHATSNGTRFQIAETFCDGADNDCNGQIDEGCCEADEALNNLVTSQGGRFELASITTNSDRTQAAVAVVKGTDVGIVAFDEDRTLLFQDLDLSEVSTKTLVSLHNEPDMNGYRLFSIEGTTLSSRLIGYDGSITLPVNLELDHTFVEIKSRNIGPNQHLIVGRTDNLSVVAMLCDNRGNVISDRVLAPEDALLVTSLSNIEPFAIGIHEVVVSYRVPGPFETVGNHRLLRLKVQVQAQNLTLNDLQVIERPVFNRLGANSEDTLLDGSRMYHFRQEDAAPILGYTLLNNSPNFVPLATLPILDASDKVFVRHIAESETFRVINVDSVDGFGTLVQNSENETFTFISLSVLNNPHEKMVVEFSEGLTVLVNHFDGPDQSTLGLFTLNEEGDFRCP